MASDMFTQNCRLQNILGSWQSNVQCLVDQAHDLEQERKVSEQLSEQLRQHLATFGRQFDKIRDQVQMPSPPEATTTMTGQQQQQQHQQDEGEGKKCHDETLEKELSDIRAQLEEAKRKIAEMNSGSAAAAAAGPGMQGMSITCPSTGPVTTAALADFSDAPPVRRTSMDLFSTTGKQPQSMAANSDHNHKCGSEGALPPGGQQHGDVMSNWRTPTNMNNRNVLEHECGWTPPPLPPRSSSVSSSITDITIQEVEKDGKYVRISNRSATKDEQIGCCTLQQSEKGKTTVVFRFPARVTLSALGTVTVWSGSGTCDRDGPDINFRFRELKAWGSGDGYTTVFRRANGQTIAFLGGAGRGRSQSGDKDGGEEAGGKKKTDAKVPIVKNSMSSRLNNNKSDCIQVKQTQRFNRRVITPTGDTGKPQCGIIEPAPGSCDAYRKLISDV